MHADSSPGVLTKEISGTVELETSNLAGRFINGDIYERSAKLGQRGLVMGHMIYFWNVGTLSICRELLELYKRQIWHADSSQKRINEKKIKLC